MSLHEPPRTQLKYYVLLSRSWFFLCVWQTDWAAGTLSVVGADYRLCVITGQSYTLEWATGLSTIIHCRGKKKKKQNKLKTNSTL